MADPFSIAVSVGGILDASANLVTYLISVKETATLDTIQKESGIFGGDERVALNIRRQTKSTLDDYEVTLKDFDRQIRAIVEDETIPPLDKVRWFLGEGTEQSHIVRFWQDILTFDRTLDVCITIIDITAARQYSTASTQAWIEIASLLRTLDSKLERQVTLLSGSTQSSHRQEQIHEIILQAYEARSLTCLNEHFLIPRATSSIYKGRADILTSLRAAYDEVRYTAFEKRFVIYGGGGSGKTEFCCRFAQENRHQFWAVFFIDASTTASENASWAEIAKIADVEPTAKSVKYWLSTQQRPWLLIVDDLDGFIGTGPRERFFTDCESGFCLISTRDPSLRITGNFGSKGFSLGGLRAEDAIDLFLTSAGLTHQLTREEMNTAKLFCTEVEYLPLALVDAGTAIRQGHCTLDTCLANFNKCLNHVQAVAQRQKLRTDGYETVFATFEMNACTTSHDGMELLRVLSFMHRNNFALEILIQAVVNVRLEASGGNSPTTAAPSGKGQTLQYLQDISFRLYNFFVKLGEKQVGPGLMSSLGDSDRSVVESELRHTLLTLEQGALIQHCQDDDSFSMHPLHHYWARESMTLPERAVWCCVARDVLANVILLPPLGMSEGYAQLRRRMLPHIEHVKEQERIIQAKYQENLLARSKLWPSTSASFSRSDIKRFAKFAMVYAENGQWKEASELLTTVDEFLTTNLGVQHPTTIKSRLFLSETYFWQAKEEKAIELQQGLLEACMRSRGEDDIDTLTVMDKLGFSYWMRGKFLDARDLLERAVAGLLNIQPVGAINLYIAMTHLGRVVGKLADFDDAVELNTQAVTGLLDILKPGQSIRDLLDAKESAAMARFDRHRYAIEPSKEDLRIAYSLQREVFETREKLFGKQHPLTLYALCNFARIKAARGDLFEAEQMIREGVPIAERNLGKDNLGTLFGKAHLGNILMLAGDIAEAEEVLEQVVLGHERVRGFHPDQMVAASYLLACYTVQGKIQEARGMHAKVMAGLLRIFGPDSWWETYFMTHYNPDHIDVQMGARRPSFAVRTPVSPPRQFVGMN
ncbi:hypothetical protein AMS68_003451 [Peltaster fructicola]|uniref:NB-ARC domain-containing protein n=1 Tax=Peltaster fructicola TaxID=286661 RepID=A0A6H0XT70_9PEZI|nr:hypothetical protein AMS68_003451 [Peltaster fructicola]